MYKLVAIDIDGTLLNDNHEVTTQVKDSIRRAKANGVKIVLCTGRPLIGVEQYLSDLELREEGDYVISFNGAMVQDTFTNEVISHLTLTYNDLKEIYAFSQEVDLHMHFFDRAALYTPNRHIGKYTIVEAYLTGADLIYTEIKDVPQDLIMSKAMLIDDPKLLEAGIAKIPSHFKEKYHLVKSTPFYLEILNKEASKGNAVRDLANRLGFKQSEIICIGDQENDMSMIRYAGLGVAMGNATSTIKDAADFITESNNDSGVAVAIQKFILD